MEAPVSKTLRENPPPKQPLSLSHFGFLIFFGDANYSPPIYYVVVCI